MHNTKKSRKWNENRNLKKSRKPLSSNAWSGASFAQAISKLMEEMHKLKKESKTKRSCSKKHSTPAIAIVVAPPNEVLGPEAQGNIVLIEKIKLSNFQLNTYTTPCPNKATLSEKDSIQKIMLHSILIVIVKQKLFT